MFRPSLQLSKSDGLDVSTSATFSEDPYAQGDDPRAEDLLATMQAQGSLVNRQRNTTVT